MTTLLATYRRPEGGDDALTTFLRRYHTGHHRADDLKRDPHVAHLRCLGIEPKKQRTAGNP